MHKQTRRQAGFSCGARVSGRASNRIRAPDAKQLHNLLARPTENTYDQSRLL
jgi:hypothetical protein